MRYVPPLLTLRRYSPSGPVYAEPILRPAMSASVTTAPETGGPSVRRTVPKTVSVSRSAAFSTMSVSSSD